MNKLTRPTPVGGRGLTFIEVIITASLVSLTLLGGYTIVGQFNSAAASELSRNEAARQVTAMDALLRQDVAAARPCKANRIGTHWSAIHDDVLEWTIDPDGSGQLERVTWSLSGGQLSRTVVPMTSECAFATGSPSVLLTSTTGAGPSGEGLFTSADGDTPGDCTLQQPSCAAHTDLVLQLRVIARDGTIVPLSRQLNFPTDRSRMRP